MRTLLTPIGYIITNKYKYKNVKTTTKFKQVQSYTMNIEHIHVLLNLETHVPIVNIINMINKNFLNCLFTLNYARISTGGVI